MCRRFYLFVRTLIDSVNQHYIEKFGSLSLDIVKSNIDELSYGETPFTSQYTGKLSHDDLLMFVYHLIRKHPVILRKIAGAGGHIGEQREYLTVP